MMGFRLAATALTLGVGVIAGSSFVPATVDQAIAATRQERAAARVAKRVKRQECRKEADAQKLRFIKRSRFLRACNKNSS